jgi:hypothetical protein
MVGGLKMEAHFMGQAVRDVRFTTFVTFLETRPKSGPII